MPATPRTILAPLPNDPRIMALAKSVGLPRREAFAVAAEAWAWMAAVEVGGLVKKTRPDSLDSLVDVVGFGAAMLQAGLVGVVDDSLVLPAELRHHEADQGESRRRAAAVSEEEKAERRREQNRESARRCRANARLTRPAATPAPSVKAKCRSLGRVAGHEVRVFDGPHGVYASVLNATLDGKPCRKLTAGDKGWSIESVSLLDVLPALVEKAQKLTSNGLSDPLKLTPPVATLEEAARREQMKAALLEAEAADQGSRHADASASQQSQHDASASVSKMSASADAGRNHNFSGDNELPRQQASGSHHADGCSSMSSLSSSSLSSQEKREEEEREIERRSKALRGYGAMAREARKLESKFVRLCAEADERWTVIEYVDGKERKNASASAAAADLGMTEDEVRRIGSQAAWLQMRRRILDTLEAERDRIIAEASSKPADARDDIAVTTEPHEGDKPATGDAEPPGDDERHDDHDGLTSEPTAGGSVTTGEALEDLGIPTPTLRRPPDAGRRVDVFGDDHEHEGAQLLRQA